MVIVNERAKECKFKNIEQELYEQVCQLGRTALTKALEWHSEDLHRKRDKKVYRDKGKRKTCIKTVMGPVEYTRHIYQVTNEVGKHTFVYLLDQWLGMETIGFMSENLVSKIVENSCNMSYRNAAKAVSEATGQSISHATAWKVVQQIGTGIEKQEKRLMKKYDMGELDGKKEIKVLFEEADGVYLSIQRRGRKSSKGERKEFKLAVIYEGWKRQPGKSERYHVVNKSVVAGFMDSESFKTLRQANIAAKYNVDKVQYHVLNGDGAEWIQSEHVGKKAIFQLDPFHWKREILRATSNKKETISMIGKLMLGEVEPVLSRLTELKYECGGEEVQVKKLTNLETYLKGHKEALIPWQQREEKRIPSAPEGIEYRNMGTMEHQIFDVIGVRMKGLKMSWSIQGANNLGKILAGRKSGKLTDIVATSMLSDIPEDLSKTITTQLKTFTAAVKKNMHKVYRVQKGGWPFEGMPTTNSRKVIRSIFEMKNFSELIYR